MARSVFFSFHYDNDVQRAMVVRQSWVTKTAETPHGVIDKAAFEELQKQGTAAVHNWINSQMQGTTVTVFLIGSETLQRPFVKYELELSKMRGNAIIGIFINNIPDFNQQTTGKCSTTGFNYRTYDWVNDNGYKNLGDWVEAAAIAAGK